MSEASIIERHRSTPYEEAALRVFVIRLAALLEKQQPGSLEVLGGPLVSFDVDNLPDGISPSQREVVQTQAREINSALAELGNTARQFLATL